MYFCHFGPLFCHVKLDATLKRAEKTKASEWLLSRLPSLLLFSLVSMYLLIVLGCHLVNFIAVFIDL